MSEDVHDHINVTGEEGHQDALRASLGDDWVGDHPFSTGSTRVGTDPKGRKSAAVGLDGQLVGWLTPKMSERFLPAIEATIVQGPETDRLRHAGILET